MARIAIITGASSGMGRRFAETAQTFGKFDELWVIARRAERFSDLKSPFQIRPIQMDLTDRNSYTVLQTLLKEENPEVGLLVNAGGFGKFEAITDTSVETNLNMVDLNCQALQALCQITIPYMTCGSAILNIASVAAFQPVPYIGVYAASKAFVLSYSRALNRELRGRGIQVTALCPFWTRTEFFDRAVDTDKPAIVKKYIAMYDPADIVERAWRDLKRGKDVAQYGFIARGQAVLCKILPHSFVMWVWQKQQKLC